MPTKTWKNKERQVAGFFGTKRCHLSGSNSGHDTCSDSLHGRLYVEQKHRRRHIKWAERKLKAIFIVQLIKQRKALGDPLSSAFADLMKELVPRIRELKEAHEKLPSGRA
jgi:hypothetical protein